MNPPTLIRSLGDYKDWLIDTLPNQGNWTEEEYLWLTDGTNRLVEFTDGTLEPLPMTTRRHQAISLFLAFVLHGYIVPQGGAVYYAPLRLRVRPGKFREPDLILIKDADDPRAPDPFWTGADLTVEIVSDDNPDRDYEEKRHDYAEGGVPEYWIVDPLDEIITVLRLQAGAYVEHGVFRRGDTATAATLPGFAVDVSAVFDAK